MKERMKQLIPIIFLVLVLLLTGCSQDSTESTLPATEAPVDYIALYTQAVDSTAKQQDLVLNLSYSDTRTVDGVSFPRTGTGTATYTGIGTGNMEALITESLTFGSYKAEYTQSYLKGKAYTQTSGTSFVSRLSGQEFLSYQIPAAVIDSNLYRTVTWESTADSKITYQFSNAKGFEAWANISPEAKLVEAGGYAVLDDAGILQESSYRLSYTLHGIPCDLEVKVTISSFDQSTALQHPQYPSNCSQLEAYLAPRLILQTVGAVYSTENLTGSQTETIYCEAAALARTQQVQVDAYSKDTDFMAR